MNAATVMIAAGSQLPHFEVDDVRGWRVAYRSSIWQRKYLLLVTRAAATAARTDDSVDLASELASLANDDVAVVVAADHVPGIPAGATVIVDRWGEVAKVWMPGEELPTVRELDEWISHVRMRCPECEGEAK